MQPTHNAANLSRTHTQASPTPSTVAMNMHTHHDATTSRCFASRTSRRQATTSTTHTLHTHTTHYSLESMLLNSCTFQPSVPRSGSSRVDSSCWMAWTLRCMWRRAMSLSAARLDCLVAGVWWGVRSVCVCVVCVWVWWWWCESERERYGHVTGDGAIAVRTAADVKRRVSTTAYNQCSWRKVTICFSY